MSEVFELRQYTLHPGKRDTLIDLFDRELVETQEAAGMRVIGQFRDLGDPDRFIWFRGFPDMIRRKEALTSFYSDTSWRTHRDVANATMIDSDNVLLLRIIESEPDSNTKGARFAGHIFALVCSGYACGIQKRQLRGAVPKLDQWF